MSNNDLHQREYLDAPVAHRIAELQAKLASAETSRDFLAKTMALIHEAVGRKGQSFQPHELPGQVQVQRAALMVALEALERIAVKEESRAGSPCSWSGSIAKAALANPLVANEITHERRRKEIEYAALSSEAVAAEGATQKDDSILNALKEFIADAEIQLRGGIADPAIAPELRWLCEKHGYGNVITTASELWRQKDPHGAFLCGPCVATARLNVAAAREALKAGKP